MGLATFTQARALYILGVYKAGTTKRFVPFVFLSFFFVCLLVFRLRTGARMARTASLCAGLLLCCITSDTKFTVCVVPLVGVVFLEVSTFQWGSLSSGGSTPLKAPKRPKKPFRAHLHLYLPPGDYHPGPSKFHKSSNTIYIRCMCTQQCPPKRFFSYRFRFVFFVVFLLIFRERALFVFRFCFFVYVLNIYTYIYINI